MRAKFFWGSNVHNRKIYWIGWDQSRAGYDKGGLNIGSLRAFNIAFLCKWIWRLKKYPNSIWARMVKAIHGESAGADGTTLMIRGTWSNIVDSFYKSTRNRLLPANVLRAKIGDGHSFRFWHDNWLGNGLLKDRFRRLYHLDSNKYCSVADCVSNGDWSWSWRRSDIGAPNTLLLHSMVTEIGTFQVSNGSDSWLWSLGLDGEYYVANTRNYIDDAILPTSEPFTRWLKCIPRKINVFIWRVAIDSWRKTCGDVYEFGSTSLCRSLTNGQNGSIGSTTGEKE
ncbi:uncharacterized protein [Rutidosis leptorrhynchoides]|uniref:uncharacterized protein n=1 Tax=Rutidosis leptorrhynchoides TaxID=125765 RepID=UPI003A990566